MPFSHPMRAARNASHQREPAKGRTLAHGALVPWSAVLLSVTLLLGACGSAPGGGTTKPPTDPLPPDTPPTGPIANVDDQLRELGIDVAAIAAAPRKLDASVEATTEYSPLGMRARLAPKELFSAGTTDPCTDLDPTTPDDAGPRVMSFEVYDESVTGISPSSECYHYEVGNFRLSTGPDPDNGLAQPGTQSSRAIVTGNFDADAFDEGGVVIADTPPSPGEAWWLRTYRTGAGEPFTTEAFLAPRPLGTAEVKDVASVAGDFTGDGVDDVIVAILKDDYLELIPFPQQTPGSFDARSSSATNFLDLADRSGVLSVRLAAGNLDLDPQFELVVLVRSIEPSGTAGQPHGEVRSYLYDDLAAYDPANPTFVLPLLQQGLLTYQDPTSAATQNLLTADVAIGDFDGDGLGELAFTGIGHFPYPDPCQAYQFAYAIRDDLPHGGGTLATRVEDVTVPSSYCDETTGVVYEVFARALDYDGDYDRELLANAQVLELVDGELNLVATVPNVYRGLRGGHFAEATTSLTTGDANNDGREDVISFAVADGTVRIHGMGDFDLTIPRGTGQPGDFPVLAAYDDDLDGTTVQYEPGSHRVVLTEPIIIAALAAPPYAEAYGQDGLSATTSYGTSTSSGASSDTTVSVTANASIGLEVGIDLGIAEFSGSYAETFSKFKDKTRGTGYDTTYTDTYETAGRDAVVFTSFPYDAYDYAIVASDQSQLVGQTMTLLLPRRPITRIVSKEYFNARVPDGNLRIDDDVFSHTAGDPTSYMTQSEMNDLREAVNTRTSGPTQFLASSAKTIGQGTTSTSTAIELSHESYYTEAVGYAREQSVETNLGGALVGYSIGKGESHSVTTQAGSATEVSSTLPSITVDDTTDPGAVYDYGMFTYMYRDLTSGGEPGQMFQVVNFWAD